MQQAHHPYQGFVQQQHAHKARCCCCIDGKIGLWFLAVWWIIQILWSFFMLFRWGLRYGSLYWIIDNLIVIGAFLPPTIVFFQMISHHHDAKHRHRLHKTYMISAVYFGVPATLWHLQIPFEMMKYCR